MKKLKVSFLVVIFAIALSLSTIPAFAIVQQPPPDWEAEEDMVAGQHIDAGQILIRDDFQYLTIRFKANVGWRISETHLQIATSLAGIPQTKTGNPIPGKFEYKGEHDSVESYQYQIPMTWTSGTTVYIAAHCTVEGVGAFCGQSESAWGGNILFSGRNWAKCSTYVVEYRTPVGYS